MPLTYYVEETPFYSVTVTDYGEDGNNPIVLYKKQGDDLDVDFDESHFVLAEAIGLQHFHASPRHHIALVGSGPHPTFVGAVMSRDEHDHVWFPKRDGSGEWYQRPVDISHPPERE